MKKATCASRLVKNYYYILQIAHINRPATRHRRKEQSDPHLDGLTRHAALRRARVVACRVEAPGAWPARVKGLERDHLVCSERGEVEPFMLGGMRCAG